MIAEWRHDRAFHICMALLFAAIVFVGFARTFFLRNFFTTVPLRPFLILHGIIFSSWLVLMFVQTALVAAKRTSVHRRLGVGGGLLAALMIVVGILTAIHAARNGPNETIIPRLRFLVIPLGDISLFAALVCSAFFYRGKPDMHKRLMFLATIDILAPAIARFPFAFISANGPLAFFGGADLVLSACILYDLAIRRQLHPAYLWGGMILVVSQPVRLFIGRSDAWLVFARWLIGA